MRSFVATVLGMWAGPAAAFCGTYVGSPGVDLTNSTSQVIIARQGNTTTLTLANDYQGTATDFAMLIPVPEVLEEDDIQTVRPELFQRFNDYSTPRIVTYQCSDFYWEDEVFGGGDDGGGMELDSSEPSSEPPPVVVEGEYAVGIYEIVILSATESGALITWLDDNGFGADANAQEMLDEYIADEQFFFAAKVNLEEVPAEGTTLEPLQFSYESEVFGLPVRLGTLNSPGEQDVIMYILTDSDDGKVGISNYTEVTIEDECMVDIEAEGGASNYYGRQFAEAWAENDGEGWITEYAWATNSCDPCPTEPPTQSELNEAGFDGETWDSYFTRLRVRYTPDASEDIMMYTSGIRETSQIRFIDYNIEMEDRFEVCGVGMVEDPGSCDEASESGGGSDGGHWDGDDDETGSGGTGSSGPGGTDRGGSNGWMGEGASTSESVDEEEEDDETKGGCSHTGGDGAGLSWAVLGLMGLAMRRRRLAR